jgi:UDP-glucose:glycoprotein glucosyltransferase
LRAHADADGGGASERVRLGAGAGGLECEHACVALPALALAGGGADAGLSAALHLVALVDPLSRAAQRIAPVLSQLRAALGARVTVYLNPRGAHADLPLNEFYRFAAPHAPAFDERGRRVAHGARFAKLATAQTLTLHLDTPAGWLTEPSDCAHDMDNLRLADVGGGGEGKAGAVVTAEYRLAALLISGSCDDLSANEPPNGLQLVLAHAGAAAGARGAAGRPLADTLVMQNLGYFQLQASPGLFALRLEAGSRSEELYTLLELPAALRAPARARGRDGRRRQAATFDAAELAALEPVGERRIALRSFDGASATLLVRKRPGMERKRLLDGDAPAADGGRGRGGAQLAAGEGGESLWGKASSLWSGAAGARGGAAAADDDGKVHVFSLASGHLYERFLKIMMLSVAGKSSKPVKFWLIRNFLSASFMAFAPQLAREKGFEVEFVRYQWPPWLRAQSDKQRIIWGYAQAGRWSTRAVLRRAAPPRARLMHVGPLPVLRAGALARSPHAVPCGAGRACFGCCALLGCLRCRAVRAGTRFSSSTCSSRSGSRR